MATFSSTATKNLGTSQAVIFTAVSSCVIIGLNAANVYGSELPIDVIHKRGSNTVYILKQFRVGPGETQELMRGNKIVLQSGDTLEASTAVNDGFDILVSALEGV